MPHAQTTLDGWRSAPLTRLRGFGGKIDDFPGLKELEPLILQGVGCVEGL
jgi:hypothetical protein